MKFSDIHQLLQDHFHQEFVAKSAASYAIQEAFPKAVTRRAGKSRSSTVFGVSSTLHESAATPQPVLSTSGQSATGSGSSLYTDVQAENREFREKIAQLEAQVHSLKSRVQELQSAQQLESAQQQPPPTSYVQNLVEQMDAVVQYNGATVHGPDTVEHFASFSFEAVTQELQQYAPDLHRLFLILGDTARNAEDDEVTEARKATVSLLTLLNAKSNRVNGIQLLMGVMLVARATHKQVYKINKRK